MSKMFDGWTYMWVCSTIWRLVWYGIYLYRTVEIKKNKCRGRRRERESGRLLGRGAEWKRGQGPINREPTNLAIGISRGRERERPDPLMGTRASNKEKTLFIIHFEGVEPYYWSVWFGTGRFGLRMDPVWFRNDGPLSDQWSELRLHPSPDLT